MKILILGATGRTGKHLLQEALERGYVVHVLVRDKTKIRVNSDNLIVFTGTPLNKDSLRDAMKGCEAVLSALNISRTSDFPWAKMRTPVHFLSDTMKNLIELCRELNVKRVIVTSAWGVGNTWNQLPGWFRWMIQNSNIGPAYRDHEVQENLLKESDIEWTCVRPVGLINSKKKKQVKVIIDDQEKPSLLISRRNVAAFMLDELEQNKFIKQLPVICQ